MELLNDTYNASCTDGKVSVRSAPTSGLREEIENRGDNDQSAEVSSLEREAGHKIMEVTVITSIPSTYTQTSTSSSITAPPSFFNRAALAEPQAGIDCNSQIDQFKSQASQQNSQQLSQATQQFSQQVSQISQKASQSVSQALAVQTSAQIAQSSAQAGQSSAQAAADVANSSLSSIKISASSAVAAASASASGAAMSASAIVSSALLSASSSVSKAISSADSSASAARATATFAIAQAQATISVTNSQASASVRSSQVQAITATQAAIAIVGSIIGSSLLSILLYFLLSRYRKRKQNEIENNDFPVKNYKQPLTLPISEPKPIRISYIIPTPPPDAQFPDRGPFSQDKFWSMRMSKTLRNVDERSMDVPLAFAGELEQSVSEQTPRPSLGGAKRTLVYDADFPSQPPKFDDGEELGDFGDGEKRGGLVGLGEVGKKASIGKAI
ncbi:uncharacterized protein EAF01_002835 [Botrytis porri]|uniref:Uncharacterized protein n=1 Tax=Botrytis porri TaxID=87229 RepID=A0A4Z1KWU0_9HELO|nr:uncharacterized protein EAF01_002835 [Botrytis porri]KAF7911328.1 hypothetical protein EAF01_002835 [Botrytis porri]TGO89027.1 hypothetical protein BPOR_0128g00010 [Botrytis porri]